MATRGAVTGGRAAGLPTVSLESPEGLAATFVPAAGMVGSSLSDRGQELLGQRGGLEAWIASSSTFGIPLLYPWANRLAGDEYEAAGLHVDLPPDAPLVHRDSNGLPIHGLLFAAHDWEVVESGPQPGGAGLRARLDWGADPRRLSLFPFAHQVEVTAVLAGLRLEITTAVLAGQAGPVPVAFGWHPYLAPPGAPREEWEVRFPPELRLETDGRQIPTGTEKEVPVAGGRLGERTLDDGYGGVAPGTACSVADGARRITVEMTSGYPFAQLYAPADPEVICFEPMTAPANALASGDGLVLVEPGDRFSATFAIAVEPA